MGELWLNGISYSGGGGADVEITGEASGAIASFADGSANPLKSLEVDINPIQDLHGYDKPWSAGAGKNKINLADIVSLAGFVYNRAPVNVVANTYTLSFNFTGGSGSISISLRNGETIVSTLQDQPLVNGLNTFTMPTLSNNADSISLYAGIGGTYENFMLEVGSQATSYEPYTNICPISGRSSVEVTVADDTTDPTKEETYEISLGQTIYGGKLNVTTGELTVDKAMVDLGTLSWNRYNFSGTYAFYAIITGKASGEGVCENYSNSTSSIPNLANGQFNTTENATYVYIRDDSYTEATAFKTAMDGVKLIYKLATPTTATLTPTEVDSLLGNNNIWADSGDSDVVYIRDIDKAFNILWDAVMNSNSGTRSLNLMKGAISEETKEDIEEPIKEEPTEEETKEGNDENQR